MSKHLSIASIIIILFFHESAAAQDIYIGIEPVADRAVLGGDGSPALAFVVGGRYGEQGLLRGEPDWELSLMLAKGTSGSGSQAVEFRRHVFRQALAWSGHRSVPMRYRLGYEIVARESGTGDGTIAGVGAAAFASIGIEGPGGLRAEFLADTQQSFSLLFSVPLW